MFYEDYCKTDTQKAVYKRLMELTREKPDIALHDVHVLGIPDEEILETIRYFEQKNLFEWVQHSSKDPVVFRIWR